MNKASLLLRIAGGLCVFVCLGHTAGTFMSIPASEVEVTKTAAAMKTTLVPMPIGKPQSYADLFLGTNLSVSLFLVVLALGFFFASGDSGLTGHRRKFLLLMIFGCVGLSAVSALYFFPLPAICTGTASLLGLVAYVIEM